ncbi:hypothetical protein AMTRI_Chr01g137250 [Amborella trichopoda]
MEGKSEELEGEMEVEAYRRLFPLQFYERHLSDSVRPDARPLNKTRPTSIVPAPLPSADASAMVKIGNTTMLSGIKLEIMFPSSDSPDEGCIAIDFHMPPICSPMVRPGRPAEAAPVISQQLNNVIMSSKLIDLKELSIASGKAAWMVYLEIYCLDADGALFDAALLSAVAAIAHLEIPPVCLNEEGRVVSSQGQAETNTDNNGDTNNSNTEKRKLTLGSIPFSLTCLLHKQYLLVDPTDEEESIMPSLVTVVLDTSGHLISLYKPGGPVLAYTSTIKNCVALATRRVKELEKILKEALSEMDVIEN